VSGHPHHPRERVTAALGLLTVSDSRTVEDDRSGATARKLIEAAGHRVLDYRVIPDEPDRIERQVREWVSRSDCNGVIVTGGTGISPRDRTYEAISAVLDQRLDGFGELFRARSWEQIGSAAMLSRAVGGIAAGKPVFAVPGSPKAVELALGELVLPELQHLLFELGKDRRKP